MNPHAARSFPKRCVQCRVKGQVPEDGRYGPGWLAAGRQRVAFGALCQARETRLKSAGWERIGQLWKAPPAPTATGEPSTAESPLISYAARCSAAPASLTSSLNYKMKSPRSEKNQVVSPRSEQILRIIKQGWKTCPLFQSKCSSSNNRHSRQQTWRLSCTIIHS